MILLRTFLIVLASIRQSSAQCQSGYYLDSAVNKCFKVYNTPGNYFAAWRTCDMDGGILASIPNAFVNSFIGSILSPGTYFYIGLNKLSTESWSWLDGSSSTYTNWNTGAGNINQCAGIQGSTIQWGDVPCESSYPFVCMTDLLPTSGNQTCPTHPGCPLCSPRCEDGWTYFKPTNSCYRTLIGTLSFFQAENMCLSTGSHLVSIHSTEENSFVSEFAATGKTLSWKEEIWIGLLQINNTFTWTDGSPLDLPSPWASNAPFSTRGKDCVFLYADNSNYGNLEKWENYYCDSFFRGFVCKKGAIQ